MTKKLFKENLMKSSVQAVNFGSKFISNKISNNITFDIEFNSSYEDNTSEFDIYVQDDGKVMKDLKINLVVEELYRRNKVPAWINISICMSNSNNTRLNLECSGRYTNNINNIYYVDQGTFPFGIKSPQILPWIGDEEKYYLFYKRSRIQSSLNRMRWKYNMLINKIKI